MVIDILFAILMVLALVKGYQRGLIVGLFSLVAVVIGLAAAMKLSAVVAGYIGKAVNISQEWLPFVSFLVVFIGVVLLVRLGANAIERTVEVVLMGWLNKLGGIALYVILYTLVFSVLLFYAGQLQLLQEKAIQQSIVYDRVQPLGPKVIDGIGSVLPFFRDMFTDLENFFGKIAADIPPA